MTVNAQQIVITPAIAASLLSKNTRNRPINQKRVADLAREMTRGGFKFNGDTIRVDVNGVLLDGQHRLSACVASGCDFQCILVTGLPPEVMPTIDQHSKRTVGHVLAIEGVKNSNFVAAAIRNAYGVATGTRFAARLNATEVILALSRHPRIHFSCDAARACFPKTSAYVAAIHYIGVYFGRDEQANLYVETWKNGIPQYDGCPIHASRERMLHEPQMSPTDRMKLCIWSWLKFLDKTSVSRSQIPSDPRIPGWDATAFNSVGPDGINPENSPIA